MKRLPFRLVLVLLVALASCSKRKEQSAATTASQTVLSSASSGSISKTPPLPKTQRLFPKTVAASSETLKLSDAHPAWNAFDGRIDSAWSESVKGPGKGEWLEATFATPRHLRSIRVVTGFEARSEINGDLFFQNAHVKALTITSGDGKVIAQRGVAEGERAVTFANLDLDVMTVRVTFDDVWPGRKWEDLSISEIELTGDVATTASGFEAPPSLGETLPELAKIKGVTKRPYDFLLTLGFPEPVVHEQQWSKVKTARVIYENLDSDPEPEALVEVSLAPPQDAPPRPYVRFFYALVDDGKQGLGVIGRRDFYALACGDDFHPPGLVASVAPLETNGAATSDTYADASSNANSETGSDANSETGSDANPDANSDASTAAEVDSGVASEVTPEVTPDDPSPSDIVRVRFDRVHDPRFDDAIIEWTTPLLCDDLAMGKRFVMVLTPERGVAEEILHFEDTFRADSSGKMVDPVRLMRLAGDVAPKREEIFELGKSKRTFTFDAISFGYPR